MPEASFAPSRAVRTDKGSSALFEFSIIASGVDPHAEDFEDRFFNADCDDATIALQKGVIILDFAREAATFEAALNSAMADVRRAGATVTRIEPDHLVNLADIAKRSGLTRAAVSLYAAGTRGRGFPMPISRVTSESPLWDWVDVAFWLHEAGKVSAETVAQSRLIRQANDRLATARVPVVA